MSTCPGLTNREKVSQEGGRQDLKIIEIDRQSMEKELKEQLKTQQEELEKLKKQARRQKWMNVWFAFRE